jgi:hypothetical protein
LFVSAFVWPGNTQRKLLVSLPAPLLAHRARSTLQAGHVIVLRGL